MARWGGDGAGTARGAGWSRQGNGGWMAGAAVTVLPRHVHTVGPAGWAMTVNVASAVGTGPTVTSAEKAEPVVAPAGEAGSVVRLVGGVVSAMGLASEDDVMGES